MGFQRRYAGSNLMVFLFTPFLTETVASSDHFIWRNPNNEIQRDPGEYSMNGQDDHYLFSLQNFLSMMIDRPFMLE